MAEIDGLTAQRRALDAQIAQASLPSLLAVQEAMNGETATAFFEAATAALAGLPTDSVAARSLTQWIGTGAIVRRTLDRELANMQATVAAAGESAPG